MEGCDAKVEQGVLAALGIEVFALIIGKKMFKHLEEEWKEVRRIWPEREEKMGQSSSGEKERQG